MACDMRVNDEDEMRYIQINKQATEIKMLNRAWFHTKSLQTMQKSEKKEREKIVVGSR